MIYCFLCPLSDVCSVRKTYSKEEPIENIKLSWLPTKSEIECPMYRMVKQYENKTGSNSIK